MKIMKFQQGGPVANPAMAGGAPMGPEGAPMEGAPMEGAPAEGGQGEDPLMQLAQMAQMALQGQDCEAAMQVCEGFLMVLQQAMGGGEAAAPAPQGEPVFRKGGKILRRY